MGNNISFESEVGVSCQSEADASAARGDYLCSAPYPAVRLSTFQFSGIFSRKFWDVCHSFQSDDLLSVPDDINFGWTDDCTNGSCDVEVRLSFSGEKVLSATQLAADRLEVVLNGTVYSEQANPFFNSDQLIAVESVELGFQKTSKSYQKNGKLRTIGTCTWYTDMSGDQVEVEFWSMDD